LERLEYHPAMPLMLLTVHGQKAASEPALGGILGTPKREKARVKGLGITQDLLRVLRAENKNQPLAFLLQACDIAVNLVKLAHAGKRIVRKIQQASQGNGQAC
jgi:hypothetical protein